MRGIARVGTLLVGAISLLAAIITIRSDQSARELACSVGIGLQCAPAELTDQELCEQNLPDVVYTAGGALSSLWIPEPRRTIDACIGADLFSDSISASALATSVGQGKTAKQILWRHITGSSDEAATQAMTRRADLYWYTSLDGDNKHLIGLAYALAAGSAGDPSANHLLALWARHGFCIEEREQTLNESGRRAVERVFQPGNELLYNPPVDLELVIGQCVPPNPHMAAKYLGEAIKTGYLPSKYLSVVWLENGKLSWEDLGFSGSQADYVERVFADISKIAGTGDARANYMLAEAHLFGRGTPVSPSKAAELHKLVADQGYGIAQERYACLHDVERTDCPGLKKSVKTAQEYYKKAVDNMHPQAMHAFGFQFCGGDAVSFDATECVRLLKAASMQGSSRASYKLGNYYAKRGDTGKANKSNPDLQAAFRWYALAGDRGLACGYARAAQVDPEHPDAQMYFNYVESYFPDDC